MVRVNMPTETADKLNEKNNERVDRGSSEETLEAISAIQEGTDGNGINRRSTLKLLGAVPIGFSGIGTAAADSLNDEDNGVEILEPEGAIEPTATWSVGARAGDWIHVAGMRGIDPETDELVEGPEERIRQGFANMQHIAESEGATLNDAARIVVYVSDMFRYRPIVNEMQQEFWDGGPYPPRSIIEVQRMNQDDIFEVEGTFYIPENNGVEILEPERAIEPTATWSVGARAGDWIHVAGMRGIDPETDELVEGPEERIRQGFANMQHIAESEGATLNDAARIVVYVSDMFRYRPIVNEMQQEFWDDGPYPPRSIIEVQRMNQDDIFEVEGYFHTPGVEILEPEGAIEPTATWSVGARAGDWIHVAGMRGIDPETDELVEGPEERIRQGFANMQHIAESEGATLNDAARIIVYVSDMFRYRPIVNEMQQEFWDGGPYPPRSIIEVQRMNQDDIFEVEGYFYAPEEKEY